MVLKTGLHLLLLYFVTALVASLMRALRVLMCEMLKRLVIYQYIVLCQKVEFIEFWL